MTTMTTPAKIHEALGMTKTERIAATTAFCSDRGGDATYCITETPDGRVFEWNTFDAADAQLTQHANYNDAAASIVAGCKALYLEYHGIDECEISLSWTDGRITGFRLSRDTDGQQHGDDETFGQF